MCYFCVCVLPGSAGTLLRWGGKINQLLIAQSLGNVCVKNCECRIILARVTAKNVVDTFLRHSVVRSHSLWNAVQLFWLVYLVSRTGFKGGKGARAPGLPPTGSLPPSPLVFFRSWYVCVLHFKSLGFYSLPLSDPKWAGTPAPHQQNPALSVSCGVGCVQSGKVPWLAIAKSPRVWAVSLAHFTNNWGYYTLLTWLPMFLKKIHHFDMKSVSRRQSGFKLLWKMNWGLSTRAETRGLKDRVGGGVFGACWKGFLAFKVTRWPLLELSFIEFLTWRVPQSLPPVCSIKDELGGHCNN